MKRITAVIIIVLVFSIFAACGSNGAVLIDKHTVSKDDLMGMCKNPDHCNGHADWGETPEGQRFCHIYLMSESEYVDSFWYHQSWGHESRHCEEGDFH